MKLYLKYIYLFLFIVYTPILLAQTKVNGTVRDEKKAVVSFATVYFKSSSDGVLTDVDGKFKLETDNTQDTLVVSLTGFQDQFIPLRLDKDQQLNIVLLSDNTLDEIKIYVGKTSKKDNPAIDILRKIWANKEKNSLQNFNQYQYSKYEKIEFDLNSIDSTYTQSKLFKGMEFIFDYMSTSDQTGKSYLPIFINEQAAEVYADNVRNLKKSVLTGNKNSGFNNNQYVIGFLKDLYVDYNIYDNYLKLFDKDFTSPISTTGINVYNYVLTDSTMIDNRLNYNIVFYPRRKGELTFKGDFWVSDKSWAITSVNLTTSKGTNINWVKDIYLEQEFKLYRDSIYILTKDHMVADFSLTKKEESKGLYGRRTTYFKNHKFNVERPTEFYKQDVNTYNEIVMDRNETFWNNYRFEPLSKEELGIYQMLDTLQNNKRFNAFMNLGTILASEYWQVGKFDYGPIFSTFGYNEVEGLRLRAGGRTYFGPNDRWRLEGYLAYGFKDNQFKYGLSGKLMLDKDTRLIIFGGNRRDVEQIGATLSPITDILGRSIASSSLFASGDTSKLTSINFSTAGLEIEPVRNLTFLAAIRYKTLKSASDSFNLDYYSDIENKVVESVLEQSEISIGFKYTPKRKAIGNGVDRTDIDTEFPRVHFNYTLGVKGLLGGDFDYKKVQVLYKHPMLLGGLGRFTPTLEAGKTFGAVPLGLLSVIPGNQSYFTVNSSFSLLNYYEFVTDQYITLHLEHNFGGRIFSRIPYIRDLGLREIIGFRGAYGNISEENKALNASNLIYKAPNEQIYYEYYVGIGNIFKFVRIDLTWRGNYLDVPDTYKMGVKASFGFHF